jgi:hypothetical protein
MNNGKKILKIMYIHGELLQHLLKDRKIGKNLYVGLFQINKRKNSILISILIQVLMALK